MSSQYYASFVIHDDRMEAATEYSGIIELQQDSGNSIGGRELATMLAHNLDVDPSDVELLQWGVVH
jgi:hypothetical protein